MSRHSVEYVNNCVVLRGLVPLDIMSSVLKKSDPDAVICPRLGIMMGATMVIGLRDDLDALISITPRKRLPTHLALKLGAEVSAWVEEADIGSSSTFLLWTLTGFNAMKWYETGEPLLAPVSCAHPKDPADFARCRRLLESDTTFAARLPKVAPSSREWDLLVQNWSELCREMDFETPNWRTSPRAAPRTYGLMSEILRSQKLREPVREKA